MLTVRNGQAGTIYLSLSKLDTVYLLFIEIWNCLNIESGYSTMTTYVLSTLRDSTYTQILISITSPQRLEIFLLK